MSFWDKEKVANEVEINEKNKVIVKKVSKNGKEYVDVRKYYIKDGEWLPGKGISIPDDLVDEIADIMMESGGIKL